MFRPRQMRWRASAAAERRPAAGAVALLLLIVARLAEGARPDENHLRPRSGIADGGFDDLEDDSHAADSGEDRDGGGGGLLNRRPDGEAADREDRERDENTVRALLAVLNADEGVAGRYGNISLGCSSRCSMNAGAGREASECWLSTLAYFEGVLVGLMRRFVTVTTNVAIWQHKHGVQLDFEAMAREAVGRLEALAPTRVVDKNRPLSHDELQRIVGALVRDVQSKTEAILAGRAEIPRTLDCPRACEKHIGVLLWLPMHWMFALSCLVTAALIAFIVGAIVVLDRRESALELTGADDDGGGGERKPTSPHASARPTT